MDVAAQIASVNRWLLDEGRCCATVPELQDALVQRLCAHAPIDRLWCGTTVLHPQAAAYVWIWERGGATVGHELGYDRFARMESVDSPVRRLREGAASVRFRCADPDGLALADVRDLYDRGYIELYGVPLRFRGAWVGAITWATRRPEGFSAEHIALCDGILPVLTAVIEPLARDLVFATLMRTYLGEDAGRRVAAGQVRRGDGQSMRAAVWFSDVRGFTQLSHKLDRGPLLQLLNEVFEALVEEIRPHGGQVLKFIGDGALAVFEAGEGTPAARDACARATAAADAVQRRLARLRLEREAAGLPGARVGIGLHFGEVTYGNIGAPDRLDFTVIGPAVNLAARVEGLCSGSGQAVLATVDFAEMVPGWTELGSHSVKGVELPILVYRRNESV